MIYCVCQQEEHMYTQMYQVSSMVCVNKWNTCTLKCTKYDLLCVSTSRTHVHSNVPSIIYGVCQQIEHLYPQLYQV